MFLTQRKQSRDAPGAKRSGCLSEANPKGRKGPRAAEFLRIRATTKTVVAANRRRDSRLPRRLRFDAKHHRRVAASSNLRLCRLNRHETPPGAAALKRPLCGLHENSVRSLPPLRKCPNFTRDNAIFTRNNVKQKAHRRVSLNEAK